MVLQNSADWRTGPPIVLKYVNLQKKSPFHKISGEFDSYPFLTFVDHESEFDSFSKQILQIVASTIIDSFLNLSVPFTSAALWAVGWVSNFKWVDSFSGRCSIEWNYQFFQLLSLIFVPGTCLVRSFADRMVSFSAFHAHFYCYLFSFNHS